MVCAEISEKFCLSFLLKENTMRPENYDLHLKG
jgi:hypothetical protein